MHGEVVNLFASWEGFYVILGSSAAALTGLQFVVMALIVDSERPRGPREIAAFSSPTVVHFFSALFVSAVCTAPWPSATMAGRVAGLAGLAGLVYTAIVFRRARRQKGYAPVFEDWLGHTLLPAVAYAALSIGGWTLHEVAGPSMFVIGGATVLLVTVGVHNAWDTVTYIASDPRMAPGKPTPSPPTAAPPVPVDGGGIAPHEGE